MGKCFINEDVEFDILYSKNERNIIKVNNRKEIFFEVYESNIGDKKIILEKIGEYGGLPIVTVEFKENGKIYTCEALLEDDDKNQLVVNEENLYFLRDEKNLKNNISVESTEVKVTSGGDVVNETKLNIEHTYDEKIKEYEDKKFTFLQEIEEQFEGKINVLKDDIGEKLDTFFEKLDKKKEEIINEKLEEVTSDLDNKFSKLKDDLQNIEEFSKNNVNTLLDKKIEDIDSSVNVFLEDLTKNYKEKFDNSDKKSVGNYLNLKNLTEKFNKNKEVYDKKFKDLFEIKDKLNDQDELVVKNNEILEFINDEFNTINNKFLYLTEKENEKYNELLAAVSKKDVVEYKTILKEKIQDVELGLVKEELKDEITQNFKNEIISLKRYAEMTSGGGSVAKQYARGGTMEGTLDITTGEILSAGINITNLLSSAGEADTLADVTGRGATTEITTTFKNLSSADLNVTNNIHASNIISDTGTFTTIDALTANFSRTIVTTTSALSVLNHGTGPALFVRQEGNEPVAHFMDANGDDVVIDDNGKVGIGTLSPSEKLTINGNISGNGSIVTPTLSTNQTTNLSTADVKIIGQKITIGTSNNLAAGANSFVGGGGFECNPGIGNNGRNRALGNRSATLGGAGAHAKGNYSTVIGGTYALNNYAKATGSLAAGGCGNTACGQNSVSIGGLGNLATGANSVAIGGSFLKSTGANSVAIGGGNYPIEPNCAAGDDSVVIGGGAFYADGSGGYILKGNKTFSKCSAIIGGVGNIICSTANRAAIIGGYTNKLTCPDSFILGRNLTGGLSSTVFVNNLSAQSTIFEAGNRVCTSEADTLATVTGRGASTTTTTTFNNLSAADLNVTNNIRTCNVFASGGKFTGKVGIGTSSPILPLQVESTINALADTDEPENYHLLLRNPANDTSEGVGLGFLVSSLTDDVGASIIYKRTGSNAKGELQFYNKQNVTADGAMTQSMTITDVGNLGIGTNVPGERLTVNGNISGNGSIVTPNLSTNRTTNLSTADVKIIGQKIAIGTSNNLATGLNSFVGGGGKEIQPGGTENAGRNIASGNRAATLGGQGTEATGNYAIALGGNYQQPVKATGNKSLAGGGDGVLASGCRSVAIGGYVVQATALNSVAIGGFNVKSVCQGSVAIGGGIYPYAQMCAKGNNSAVIGGGGRGVASGYDQGNKACGDCSGVFVGKGGVILANGKRSAIVGGTDNKIVCPDSMILGRGLTAGLSSTAFVNNLSAQSTIFEAGNRVCTSEADTLATVTSRGASTTTTTTLNNLSATNLAFSKGIDFGNRASNDTLIKVRSDSNDITVFEAAAFSGAVGVCAQYIGSGSGDDNIFVIKTDGNANAFKLDQSGDIGLGLAAQDGVNLKVSGCTRLIDDLEVGGNIQTPMISADESKSNIIIGQARPTRNGISLPTNTKHNFSSFISGANISGSQIFGGFRNCIMGQDSTIIGGNTNKIFSSTFNSGYACIGKSSSTILGGTFNTMLSSVGTGTCNTIIGGTANTVGGQHNIIINGYGSKITSTHPRYSNNRNFIGPSYASCILAGYGGYNQILTGRYNRITTNNDQTSIQRNAIINGIYNCIFGNSNLNTLLGGGSYNQINDSNYNTVGGGSSNCILGGSQTTILGFQNHSTGTRNIILGCRLRVGTDTTLTTVVNNLSSQCNVHVNGQLLGGTCQNKICNSSFTLGESDNGKSIYLNTASGTINVTVNCMTSGFATRFILEGGSNPVAFVTGAGLSGLNSFESRTCMTVPFSQADINFRSERYAFLGGNLQT